MKSLPTLFSRTSTGAVQQWTVQIDGNKFRVESGQTDGKKVLSEWTVCEPKNVGRANATTANEQAISEAQAKWDKKVKLGYTTDVTKIDSSTSFVEPMLAKDYDDYRDKMDWEEGVFVQNKYNGVRCVATLEGCEVVLKSRKGEKWVSVPHINKDLEKFFQQYPSAVLDGELYCYEHRQKLNELVKLVRKTKNISAEDLKKSEEMVRFYVYDGYSFGPATDVCVKYSVRKARLDELLPQYSKYYRKVDTTLVHSQKELDELYNKFLDDGEEGAIIRIPHSPYEGKRSKYLLKYKPENSDEGVIVKLIEGGGNWANTAKTATIEWNGKIFDATFTGTYEQGVDRLKNKKDWEGKTVTFMYMNTTGLGVPNYPRINPDNCFRAD
jgi:ATP-dependent DNA ligase